MITNATKPFNIDSLFCQLNQEQKKAAGITNGSVLVIAGAGSGKTRVITARIMHLLAQGIPSSSILTLTFTNKAAQEMKERIHHFLGTDKTQLFIGTFHSYCLYLLKQHRHLLKTPHFTILDGSDQEQLMGALLKRYNVEKKVTAKNILYQISLIKNKLEHQSIQDNFLLELFHAYEREKRVSNAFDFDDLITQVYQLFSNHVAFKQQFQTTIKHILVDEYQDTNILQHELLKQMVLHHKHFAMDSLCAVGDEDQSIYSWRGATVANILNFKKDFPDTHIVKLEQNYRSVQPILHVANHVIMHNTDRNPKQLWSDRQANNRIQIITCMSGYQEADALTQCIKSAEKKYKKKSMGILYRTHYQSRIIEEVLLRNAVAYKIIGGIQFYERQEIKDILAYLRLLINPYDRVSFFRVINVPNRGLGDKFVQDCIGLWDQEPLLDFQQMLQLLMQQAALSGKKELAVKHFLNLFSPTLLMQTPSNIIQHFLDKTLYIAYLQQHYNQQDAEAKIDNIKELLRAVNYFQENGVNSITDFLAEVALMQEKIDSQTEQQDYVSLMTLHSAKGLEFDIVMLVGLEEGIFPSIHASYNTSQLEEERRLFYVGITRAKEYAIITHSRFRYTFGSMNHQVPSQFLAEIPDKLVHRQDGSNWTTSQYHTFFARWFGTTPQHGPMLTFGGAIQKKLAKPAKAWQENQPVKHPVFGIGIIKKIEENLNKSIYLTIAFKTETKKISADFIMPV